MEHQDRISSSEMLCLSHPGVPLIFLTPISIPGVGTAFGTAILLIGVACLFNRHLWLRKRVAERTIAAEKLVDGLNKALVWFQRMEKISRPHRLPWFTRRSARLRKTESAPCWASGKPGNHTLFWFSDCRRGFTFFEGLRNLPFYIYPIQTKAHGKSIFKTVVLKHSNQLFE